MRSLAGFVVHPNTAAVLLVDRGNEPVSNAALIEFLKAQEDPFDQVPHECLSLTAHPGLNAALDSGQAIVSGWLESVNRCRRNRRC